MYYERIDMSEGIHLVKSNKSKRMHDFPLLVFYNGFKFQDSVCNGCHDLLILSVNISDIYMLLSLLKMLIIVGVFITLANLKQLIYKVLCLKIVGIYKNAYRRK